MPPTSFWLRNCVTLHVRDVAMWSVVYLAMSAVLFLQGWYETYVSVLAFVGISASIYVGYVGGGIGRCRKRRMDGTCVLSMLFN